MILDYVSQINITTMVLIKREAGESESKELIRRQKQNWSDTH